MEIVPLPSDDNRRPELKQVLNGQTGQPALNQSGFIVPPVYGEIGNGPGSYYPSYDKPEKEEAFDLREFWRKVMRRKWLILAIIAIATTVTALKISQARNIYQSTATIEVGRRVPKLGKDSSMNLFYDFDNSEIKTAMFLLKSTPLLEDVVVNLKLDENEKFMGGAEVRSLSSIFKRKETPAETKKADYPTDTLNELDGADPNVSLNLRSREERDKLAPYVGMLNSGLQVTELRGTRLVQIAFNHTDPEMAAIVTNGVAQTFIERVYLKQNEKIEKTSTWLDKSTRELQAQQQKAEQALQDYTRNNNMYSTAEGKDDLTTTKLAELHGQEMKAETDRLLKQSLYEEVKRGNVSKLPEAFSDQTINEVQKKLGELTVSAAQLSVKYGSRNPKFIEVQQQMEALRKEIDEKVVKLEDRLKADYERAVRDENSLKAALNRAKGEAVQQNQTSIQYRILKQNVETAKSLYTDFLQKTKQAEIEKAETTRHISVAQPATRGYLIGPKRLQTVFMALLLSLAAGIGLAFLLDHLDNRIKTVDDVNRYVRLPALGVIPEINSNAPRKLLGSRHGSGKQEQSGFAIAGGSNVTSLADRRAAHSVAEAYRSLRTSVLLAAAGRPPKTILVTSSQPGEGKTTTIVNTAICLSQLGAKVLLIDADMRRPRVHKAFGIKNRRGLSTYLSNDVRLRDLIQPTSIPNLSVLPSGLVPPNSADLVSSEKMRYMLHKLSAYYDHILIDTPPVHSVTDPIILSRQVDGVMLVVHGGKSTREMVRHARQELINVGAKIFGVVLNNVNVQQDGYEYYYHRYYYGQQDEKNQVRGA
ncbi:MAG: polysaccharide biosynthesis tyrosine autokinase [Acidobacteria bacterium]|nr:polysaccharide biosynthesis tyrosine autokinase [Acidobacteriota bacterium]MBI3422523.1 polysaccharide biosynthesis tyrosine autokinase [Acidobacteriota bacterium]